jgi:hypothetical protein
VLNGPEEIDHQNKKVAFEDKVTAEPVEEVDLEESLPTGVFRNL